MREILFKAKTIKSGIWVEGLLWKKKYASDNIYISCFPDKDDHEEIYCVDKKTVCEYTGIDDKNGNKIFENDLLGHKLNRVEMMNGTWCINGDRPLFLMAKESEVVGNIFDNKMEI